MKAEDVRMNQRVRIVPNAVYPTFQTVLGKVGTVVDNDGSVAVVELDDEGNYWALPDELELLAEKKKR